MRMAGRTQAEGRKRGPKGRKEGRRAEKRAEGQKRGPKGGKEGRRAEKRAEVGKIFSSFFDKTLVESRGMKEKGELSD